MIDQIMACSKDDEMLPLFSQATERFSALMEKTHQVFESFVIEDEKIALAI